VNGTGSLQVRAEKVGAETLLVRIVAMVAKLSAAAPIQKLADWLRVTSFQSSSVLRSPRSRVEPCRP